jgi:hypothetical protein
MVFERIVECAASDQGQIAPASKADAASGSVR